MLRIRPFRKNDAEDIIKWTSEEREFYKWSAGMFGDFPVSEERFLEGMAGRDDNEKFFPFTAFDENGPVGFFIIRIPGEDNKKTRFGFVIVDPSLRGTGYGKQMLKLGLNFVFDVYCADSVSLGVFENNAPAYHCYKSLGFEENGESEEYEICGENWKVIEMEISR